MKKLEQIQSAILWTTLLIVPIAVSNYFLDPFSPTKFILLGIGIGLALIFKALEVAKTKRVDITLSNFDLPILVIALVYTFAALNRTPNQMEAFFYPGTALLYIVGAIFYFLLNQIKNHKTTWLVLLGSGLLLSIATILKFLGVFDKNSSLPSFLANPGFSFTGDNLTTVIFLATIIPVAIFFLIKLKDLPYKLLTGSILLVIIIGLALSISSILPGKKTTPQLPSAATSWVIATEALKESPLVGVGPGNYLSAFNKYRPVSYNASNLWSFRFSTGSNFYLTVLTEAGLIGIIAIGLLTFSVVKYLYPTVIKARESKGWVDLLLILPVVLLFAFLVVFPATLILIILLFTLLSLISKPREKSFELTKAPSIIIAGSIVALVLYVGFQYKPLIAAELSFRQAFDALSANDGKKTYDLLQQAIQQNKMVDRYHASYAQVNIAIANSLTRQKELSDENKKILEQLIQQAVREGQNTVALNRERSSNWEVLARIYQSLIPVAKDVDKFAIQAYTQAINLDPLNPNLRIVLGGIFYGNKDWDSAIDTFKLAVATKPDLANSHYNLAAAYREKGEYAKAISEMEIVLKLTPTDSSDYEKAKTELEDLKKKRPSEAQNLPSENLTPPQKFSEPINPQIELPSDANPPDPATTPAPSPSAQPTPTPSQ